MFHVKQSNALIILSRDLLADAINRNPLDMTMNACDKQRKNNVRNRLHEQRFRKA